jgi:hypothetical protein
MNLVAPRVRMGKAGSLTRSIGAATIDGRPGFVAADVCKTLGMQ